MVTYSTTRVVISHQWKPWHAHIQAHPWYYQEALLGADGPVRGLTALGLYELAAITVRVMVKIGVQVWVRVRVRDRVRGETRQHGFHALLQRPPVGVRVSVRDRDRARVKVRFRVRVKS